MYQLTINSFLASIKLAGFSCVGISGGNIEQAGVGEMCDYKINGLMEMLDIISGITFS